MSYIYTTMGCCKATRRPSKSERSSGHWRWLNCLPQHRYQRAVAAWWNLYGVRPRGLMVYEGKTFLYLEKT